MKKRSIKKLRPSTVGVDPRFNRELDEKRADRMAGALEEHRIGVPVVSERSDGTYIAIDGQHRIAALKSAKVDTQRDFEVFEGLTLEEEARLFLELNSGRKAPGVFDHYKASLVAKDPQDMQVDKIVRAAGLRVTRSTVPGGVRAIHALRAAHKNKNLAATLRVLCGWVPGLSEPACFDRPLIMGVSTLIVAFPGLDPALLTRKIAPHPPEDVCNAIKRRSRLDGLTLGDAGVFELKNIYNTKTPKRLQLHKKAA